MWHLTTGVPSLAFYPWPWAESFSYCGRPSISSHQSLAHNAPFHSSPALLAPSIHHYSLAFYWHLGKHKHFTASFCLPSPETSTHSKTHTPTLKRACVAAAGWSVGAHCGSHTGGTFALISALKHDDTITWMSDNPVYRNAGGSPPSIQPIANNAVEAAALQSLDVLLWDPQCNTEFRDLGFLSCILHFCDHLRLWFWIQDNNAAFSQWRL